MISPSLQEYEALAERYDLVPVYKAAEALEGKVDVDRIVDRTYLDQALKELS